MAVKILVADDSTTMRKIVEMTFRGEDAELVSVDSAESALSKGRETKPDVLIVDAGLDGANGYDISRTLKAGHPNLASILLTSQTHPYDGDKARVCGVDDYVIKPFDTQALIDKVQQVMQRPRNVVAAEAAPLPAPAPVAASAPGPARPAPVPMPGGAVAPAPAPVAPAAQAPAGGPGAARPVAPATAPMAAQMGPRPARGTISFGASPVGAPPKPAAQVIEPAPAPRPAPVVAQEPPQRPVLELSDVSPSPMITPSRPPQSAEAAADNGRGPVSAKPAPLSGLTAEQSEAILRLTREVVERVVWEVVPDLAETIIREEIKRLTAE